MAQGLLRIWREIRALSRAGRAYGNTYTGRGYRLSARWTTYANFRDDIVASLGPVPGKHWELVRINADTGYCDGNMRWSYDGPLTQKIVDEIRASHPAVTIRALALRYNQTDTRIADMVYRRVKTKVES